MPLYRPSELRQFLQGIDKNPLRFSSQRFLIDGNVVAKILAHVKTRTVLEIGPGPGVLTEGLLAADRFIVAVEKDPDFAKSLSRLSKERLVVIESDVLKTSLQEISENYFDSSTCTVVSNLPYHLTTPILEWLLTEKKFFSKAILMLQKEAGVRLSAKKGGLMPLLLAYSGDLYLDFTVSKNSFWPKPGVDSAVLIFEKKEKNLLSEHKEKAFLEMLRAIFSQKRKTIFHQLSGIFGKESSSLALIKTGVLPQTRPEELSLEAFLQLFEEIESFVSGKT